MVVADGVNEKLPNDEKAVVPVGRAVALLYRDVPVSGFPTAGP